MIKNVNNGKESFDVVQCGNTQIYNARNNNKGTIYSVQVKSGIPNKCSCPHHHYRGAFCKHMEAVECLITDTTSPKAVADGGVVDAALVDESSSEEETRMEFRKTECDCDELGGFPCWPCYRAKRKEVSDANVSMSC